MTQTFYSTQDVEEDADLASNADMSLAEPQSAAFSLLSRSELYGLPGTKQQALSGGPTRDNKSTAGKSSAVDDSQVFSVFSRLVFMLKVSTLMENYFSKALCD